MIADCQNCQNRVIAKIEDSAMTVHKAETNFGNFGTFGDFGNHRQSPPVSGTISLPIWKRENLRASLSNQI
jgi:hypothetical protein